MKTARMTAGLALALGLSLPAAAGEVGDRPDRAVARHRVVADEDEQVGAVDVRHRHEELVAVERPRDELVRQLVDRGRREGAA